MLFLRQTNFSASSPRVLRFQSSLVVLKTRVHKSACAPLWPKRYAAHRYSPYATKCVVCAPTLDIMLFEVRYASTFPSILYADHNVRFTPAPNAAGFWLFSPAVGRPRTLSISINTVANRKSLCFMRKGHTHTYCVLRTA